MVLANLFKNAPPNQTSDPGIALKNSPEPQKVSEQNFTVFDYQTAFLHNISYARNGIIYVQ